MGKLRRRFMQAWWGISRNLETGLHEDRQQSLNIVLANETEFPNLLQNVNALSAIQRYPLGCRLQCGERVWRYAHILAAGAAGQRGRAAVCTDAGVERGAFFGAIVAGAYTVNWTTVGVVVANQYRGGYALMQGGFVHKIARNTAGGAGAVIVLTFYEPFQAIEALPAGRTGLLLENPYANVNAYGPAPGSGSGRVMGVFMAETVVNMFTWLQTWGPAGLILTANTWGDANQDMVITQNILVSDQCLPHVGVVGNDGLQVLGACFSGGGTVTWDGENFGNIWLTIDP